MSTRAKEVFDRIEAEFNTVATKMMGGKSKLVEKINEQLEYEAQLYKNGKLDVETSVHLNSHRETKAIRNYIDIMRERNGIKTDDLNKSLDLITKTHKKGIVGLPLEVVKSDLDKALTRELDFFKKGQIDYGTSNYLYSMQNASQQIGQYIAKWRSDNKVNDMKLLKLYSAELHKREEIDKLAHKIADASLLGIVNYKEDIEIFRRQMEKIHGADVLLRKYANSREQYWKNHAEQSFQKYEKPS